jgi:RNA polymerase sigma-70 factor (ECF subfamily)
MPRGNTCQKLMLNDEQQEAFTCLWTDAQPSVSRYVRSVVRNSTETKDILQLAAVVMLRKFPEYDSNRPFLPWALGVAKFQILSHQRDLARDLVHFDSDLLEEYTRTWSATAPELSAEASAMRDCVKKVSGRSREVVRLRYYEDLKSNEIAGRVNLTAANVRVILQRVRAQLKECIQRTMRSERESL